jgi:septum site-determining protein MinC
LKTKQYSLKVFEVVLEDEEKFISFFDKNYLFFQNHLISIEGEKSEKIESYLKEKKLTYIFNVNLPKKPITKKESVPLPKENPAEEKKEEPQKTQKKHLQVLDKLIRSGQELNIDGDLLLLNKVNSGGSIIINGTLIITEVVHGSIRCNGNFMMLQASEKANILFHDVVIDNTLLQDKLNRVELINNEIVITPVLKEKSWV